LENARNYEVLEKQDKAKSDFIMMMTHELKAPLMAVQGLLDVMQKGYVGPLTEKAERADCANIETYRLPYGGIDRPVRHI